MFFHAIHLLLSIYISYGYSLSGGSEDAACRTIFDGLYSNVHANWKSVTYTDAQSRANSGYPTIGITSGKAEKTPDDEKDNPEHIVVIYPSGSTPSGRGNMDVSQAGGSCFNNGKMSRSWTSAILPKVRFYSWFE